MNDVVKGYSRDRSILDSVEAYQVLDTLQVASLLFGSITTGHRKAQERLLKLHKHRQLKRIKGRTTAADPFIYYQGRMPGQLEHLIDTNWVRLWLLKKLKTWEKMTAWEYETDYGILRCDGFAAIENTVAHSHRCLFVEVDRSDNAWDKTAKYTEMYRSGAYTGRWWVKMTTKFPAILCVTSTQVRADTILADIKKHNTMGLNFEVRLLDDIKREVIPWQPK